MSGSRAMRIHAGMAMAQATTSATRRKRQQPRISSLMNSNCESIVLKRGPSESGFGNDQDVAGRQRHVGAQVAFLDDVLCPYLDLGALAVDGTHHLGAIARGKVG